MMKYSQIQPSLRSRGPLINPSAKKRVEGLIGSVTEEGGKIHLDGRGISVPGYENGNFVGPTVVEASTTMKAYQCVQISFRESHL